MVEINCETDFVARNKEFQEMVQEATEVCMHYAKNNPKCAKNITKVQFSLSLYLNYML